mgnify:CR=1 FL=1
MMTTSVPFSSASRSAFSRRPRLPVTRATLSVGAIEVWLADGFSAQENDQLFLVEVSGTGVLQDTAVSLYNADGSAYAGLWRYDNDGSSLVITFLDIPENSLSAALLGLAAFLAVTRRRV